MPTFERRAAFASSLILRIRRPQSEHRTSPIGGRCNRSSSGFGVPSDGMASVECGPNRALMLRAGPWSVAWSLRLHFRAVARDVDIDGEEADGRFALTDGLRTQQARSITRPHALLRNSRTQPVYQGRAVRRFDQRARSAEATDLRYQLASIAHDYVVRDLDDLLQAK